MYSEIFHTIGKRLAAEHLISANFGNISLRVDSGFFIKRSGDYLDQVPDLLFVPFYGEAPSGVSREYRVHNEIYLRSDHKAVVHAHPPHAVALSLLTDMISPEDSEGRELCPLIPVVLGSPGSQDLALMVARALEESGSRCVIARGHGTFSVGETLDEAYRVSSALEYACKILTILMNLRAVK